MEDTVAFTAEVDLDDDAPKDLQIASFQISPSMIWADVTAITGKVFTIHQLSSLEDFARFIKNKEPKIRQERLSCMQNGSKASICIRYLQRNTINWLMNDTRILPRQQI